MKGNKAKTLSFFKKVNPVKNKDKDLHNLYLTRWPRWVWAMGGTMEKEPHRRFTE